MKEQAGNLEQVRTALQGITGVEMVSEPVAGPDRYLVMARMGHELDAVDITQPMEIESTSASECLWVPLAL